MKRILFSLGLIALVGLFVGCGDDDDSPTGPGGGSSDIIYTAVDDSTVFDSSSQAGVFVSSLNAASSEITLDFSVFAGAQPLAAAADWDIMFDRSSINLNGGASADGGDVWAVDLGAIEYRDITAADTNGVTWTQDAVQHVVNEWYAYNPVTHQLAMTGYVYTLTDVEGDNYIKMKIDSITGGGMPPAMGTVWFTYYYNPTGGSRTLTGTPVVGSVDVTSQNGYWGYFDFSAGSQVTPADPSTSTAWDIGFNSYELFTNSGPNGPGNVTGYPMHGDLTDPSDLAECTAQPAGAPMFPDYIASVFNGDINDADANWYDYDGTTHTLTSRAHVYLIRSGTEYYKMRIDSYYRNVGGVPTSGYYTIIWNEL